MGCNTSKSVSEVNEPAKKEEGNNFPHTLSLKCEEENASSLNEKAIDAVDEKDNNNMLNGVCNNTELKLSENDNNNNNNNNRSCCLSSSTSVVPPTTTDEEIIDISYSYSMQTAKSGRSIISSRIMDDSSEVKQKNNNNKQEEEKEAIIINKNRLKRKSEESINSFSSSTSSFIAESAKKRVSYVLNNNLNIFSQEKCNNNSVTPFKNEQSDREDSKRLRLFSIIQTLPIDTRTLSDFYVQSSEAKMQKEQEEED